MEILSKALEWTDRFNINFTRFIDFLDWGTFMCIKVFLIFVLYRVIKKYLSR